MNGWRRLGSALLAAGFLLACENKPGTPDSDAKDVGREIGKAVKGAKGVANDAKNALKDVSEGFDEGVGGSGKVDIGKHPGVIKDGEGPLENPATRPGKNPGIINDGEGPIEGRRH